VRSGTWPNRDYLLCGTSDGVTITGGGVPNVPCIMDSLDKNGVSWGTYTDDFLAWEIALGGDWTQDHSGVYTFQEFADQAAAGTLPEVAFVDAKMNIEDEHPPADMQIGEAWTKRVYDAVVKSPLWNKTAMIFVYDEAGGFFDHVPPGNTCVARPQDSQFYELGVRVPLLVISPWAKRHYVSHVMHEHTSITRLIETVFGIPAMTARDANSDALLDMFDFSCKTPAAIPEASAAGTGGCQ
jgi:phospholipase C